MNIPIFKRPTVSFLWSRASRLPLGKALFSRFIGRMAPYTGTIGATVEELGEGTARVSLRDRPAVRNHLKSVHAVALMNLGEIATGLPVLYAIDGRGSGIVTGLRMEYHKKARGTITATCSVEVPSAPGTHDLDVQATLRNREGELVATAWATWKLDLQG